MFIKELIIKSIKKGLIDAIHSYGEKKDFQRKDAISALNELRKNGCKLDIWIDHAYSSSNLCKNRFYGKGDVPQEKEYHFDLTRDFGIKFIWTERFTNIIGQGTPVKILDLLNIYDNNYPYYSLKN